jgi:hypothetical protein
MSAMEKIAAEFGVSQYTISKDLEGLLVANKPPRPKGGRPKEQIATQLGVSADRLASASKTPRRKSTISKDLADVSDNLKREGVDKRAVVRKAAGGQRAVRAASHERA